MNRRTIPARHMNGPGFHHLALRAADFEATLRFYEEGLGFTRAYGWGEGDGRAAMLDAGDGNYLEVFAGGNPQEDVPEGVLLHYALRVPDCDAAYERALAAGARPKDPPKDIKMQGDYPIDIRIAFVRGLDGEVIEFFQNDTL
jgi:glyoxylase I family protein